MRIRTRLLYLILSILLPAFLAASLAVWFVYKEQQRAQEKGMAEAARALALLVDNELENTEGILRTLANSPALQRDDFRTFYDYARSMAPPSTSTIVITDMSGRQLLNTRLPFGADLPKGNSNLMELLPRYAPGKAVISDLFFAPAGKRYDFAIQIPVMRDGQARYYLAMGMAAEMLHPLFLQQELPAGWFASVVDRKGVVVTRSQDAESYVGQTANEPLLKRILAGEKSGIRYGTSLDGRQTVGFFSRAPNSEWTVTVNIPAEEMRLPAIRAAAFLGAIMLVFMSAAVITARWYAKKTAEPIERLRLAAENLGRGQPISVTPSGLMETDSVAYALVDAGSRLQRSKADLESQVATAVAAAERAQRALLQGQKLEALGRLTAGIAHDFNNVLQTLSTAMQLINRTADPARVQALVETCNRAIDRATVLTGQMRAFGKVQDARLETIHPGKAIGIAMPLLKSALPDNLDLEVRTAEALWPVTVDPLQLELALLNIVINARDAMPDGGTVAMDLQNEVFDAPRCGLDPGEYVHIAISDRGTGMSADVLSRALEPFFTTKAVDKGTGLGLPQAYGFATQAQGTLVLHSAEGTGTTVSIYLPRAATAVREPARAGAELPELSGAGTLLFVEDDALVREAVGPALSNAGFNVVIAGSGDEALALLESGLAIDLVFSDIVMPGAVNGVELARIVQARFPHVHIVLATGYTEARANIAGVRLLAKPYNIVEAIQVLALAGQE
ncbi:MAG: cache domain-containing protein [Noviherbaspirillum sp.]